MQDTAMVPRKPEDRPPGRPPVVDEQLADELLGKAAAEGCSCPAHEDFDPGQGILLVRHTKLGKHRLVPLHPTTVTAVQDYRQLRDQRFPFPASPALRYWVPLVKDLKLIYTAADEAAAAAGLGGLRRRLGRAVPGDRQAVGGSLGAVHPVPGVPA